MRDDGRMTTPELSPRRTISGVIAVWIITAVAGIGIGLFVPSDWRSEWLTLALAASLILAFGVQLWFGVSQRFLQRVALSVLGSLLVLGVISAGFGLASLVEV